MRDLDQLFAALARSRFRHRVRLGPADRQYLAEKGLAMVLEHARRFIAERLAPSQPANDGRQTPMRGHPVFAAQHATATCCRSCLAKWHGVPTGLQLSEGDMEYILRVIRHWLEQQEPSCVILTRGGFVGRASRQLPLFDATGEDDP